MNLGLVPYILLPALAAAIVPFLRRLSPLVMETLSAVTLGLGLIAALMGIPFAAQLGAEFRAAKGMLPMPPFQGDEFSILMLVTIFIISLCSVFFSMFSIPGGEKRASYYSLILICTAGMAGVVTTGDFFTMYVFLEVVAVSSFALIAFSGDSEGVEGAVKYLFLSAPASLLILLGVALLFLNTGGTSFSNLFESAAEGGSSKAGILVALGLFGSGFMVKAGLVPFHGWVPDAYQSSPAPISALLSGIITKVAGVYALVRMSMFLNAAPGYASVTQALMFFGALSIVVGALAAMVQRDFKRLLAFSSISQVGYIVLSAGLGTPMALLGAVFHLFNHATFKATLFLNGAAVERATGTRDMSKLGGLGSRMPWTTSTSVVAFLSTAGIPPLSGFWSKLIMIVALWMGGARAYATIALLASILTLGYFLLLQRRVFFGKVVSFTEGAREVNAGMLLPVVFLAALMIIIGLYFPFIFQLLFRPAARALL
jgi:proton-translocating NADH-quinone oxidoreductase chain N